VHEQDVENLSAYHKGVSHPRAGNYK